MAALGIILILVVALDFGYGKKEKVSWKECNINAADRLDCGYAGITEEKCYQRGCCWTENILSGIPTCYHSKKTTQPECMLENTARVQCGGYGVKKRHCLAQGCCWQPNNDYNTPWCYNTEVVEVFPDTCGDPAIPPKTGSSRIVGGEEAIPHSWPWQVSLQMYGSHFCGGSIVNDQWILSAAHCGDAFLYGDVTIVVGLHNKDVTDATAQRIRASDHFQHEDYDYDEGTNNLADDIMLIRLEEPIQFSDHVSPVCIPEQDDQSFEAGMKCYVTGWGTLELFGNTPSELQQVKIPVVDQDICTEWYADPQNWYNEYGDAPDITDEMICAGFEEGGRGSCHGDSGGPFVCNVNGAWKLAGVVSWGGPCAHERTPSVFARVSMYHDWIETTIKDFETK